jgi:hypothetical protein
MRRQRDSDAESTTSARWQRRAARQDAERGRIPKHGKRYVDLAQQMIAKRASDAAARGAGPADKTARPRRPSRARPPGA